MYLINEKFSLTKTLTEHLNASQWVPHKTISLYTHGNMSGGIIYAQTLSTRNSKYSTSCLYQYSTYYALRVSQQLFNLHYNPKRQVLLFSSFYRRRNRLEHEVICPKSQSLQDAEPRFRSTQSGSRIHAAKHFFSVPRLYEVSSFPHNIHYILQSSLYFKRYLPCKNRFTVRNKNSLSVCLFRKCRYNLSQCEQGLVNTHTFLYTR